MTFPWPFRSNRVSLDPMGGCSIGHLLVVSGPSGSGKSEFLLRMEARELPADVVAVIPDDAEGWPQTSGAYIRRDQLEKLPNRNRPPQLAGLVLHYDFMRAFESRIADFDHDPSLRMVSAAAEVTVLILRPSPELLTRQIATKAARPPVRQLERKLRRFVRRIVHPRRAFIYKGTGPKSRHQRLAHMYAEPDFVEEWYRRWEDFVANRFPATTTVREVAVTVEHDVHRYRLVR